MRKFSGVILGIFLLIGSLYAEKTASVIYSCEEPLLDGKLTESCWQQGVWQQDFVLNGSAEKSVEKTMFKVVNTPRGLYIAVKAADEKLISKVRKHDESVWHDDSIEIVAAPLAEFPADENVREAVHFIVNAHACKYDAYMTANIDNAAWDPAWSAAAERSADGFTLEIFLPFSLFNSGNMESGKWRFNLLRTHKGGKVTLYSAWNPARSAGDSSNYGVLENVKCDVQRFNIEPASPVFRRAVVRGIIN